MITIGRHSHFSIFGEKLGFTHQPLKKILILSVLKRAQAKLYVSLTHNCERCSDESVSILKTRTGSIMECIKRERPLS